METRLNGYKVSRASLVLRVRLVQQVHKGQQVNLEHLVSPEQQALKGIMVCLLILLVLLFVLLARMKNRLLVLNSFQATKTNIKSAWICHLKTNSSLTNKCPESFMETGHFLFRTSYVWAINLRFLNNGGIALLRQRATSFTLKLPNKLSKPVISGNKSESIRSYSTY